MNILITGGLGFVGSNLIEAANQRGITSITVLDNESLGKPGHIAGMSARHVRGDLTDLGLLDELVKETDAIVHLAADTTVMGSINDPAHNFQSNVVGIFSVLESMRRHGKTQLVFASTGGAIIGEAELPLHENQVANPLSPYGASKLAGEGYLGAYAASFGMSTIAYRFSNVYGPKSFHKGSVVAAYMKALLNGDRLTVYGDGTQSRDFVFVSDLCDVILDSITTNSSGVFQLGSGKETTINELLGLMSTTVGENLLDRVDYLESRAGEVHRAYCDIEKAKNSLGYNPKVGLAEGLAETWQWFVAHESLFSKVA